MKTTAPRCSAARQAATARARNAARGSEERPAPVQHGEPPHAHAAGGDAEQGEDLVGRPRVGVADEERGLEAPARDRAAAVLTICTPLARSSGKRTSAGISTAVTASPARTGCGRSSRPAPTPCAPSAAGARAGRKRRKKPVTWRSSWRSRKPESRIHRSRPRTVTCCRTSSRLCFPCSASAMNVFASFGSCSSHGAWRASPRNRAKARRRPSRMCTGTGTRRRGRCAPASDSVGAVERYRTPPGRSTRWHSRRYPRAVLTCSMTEWLKTRSKVASRKGRSAPSPCTKAALAMPFSAASRVPEPAKRASRSRPTANPDSSASESAVPPPPQPASRTRPPTRTPARSRACRTFALLRYSKTA